MMLPIVEALQPRSFVDAFFAGKGCSVIEAVQVGEAGEKFARILHAIDAEFQLVDILRVEVDGGLLGGREAAVGAEIERNRPGGQQGRGMQQREH